MTSQAFEHANDPVIAEESALLGDRIGDKDGVSQRFKAFLDAYPQSPRADAARVALAKLP